MGKVCRVALVPVRDGWVFEAGMVSTRSPARPVVVAWC